MSEYKGTECPVCGAMRFERCGQCGWMYSNYQERHPEEGGCENHYSLNTAKKLWESEHRPINEIARERVLAKRKEYEAQGKKWGPSEE